MLQAIIRDSGQLDSAARDLELHLLTGGRAQNFQQKRCSGIATQVVADIVVVALGHVFTVDAEDDVALLQSHIRGRHILIGLIDAHATKLEVIANQRADAGILACEHHLHVLALVLGIVFGVGVERVEHGIDAVAHHLISVECVDIHHVEVTVDGVEHFEVLRHLEVVVRVRLRPAHRGEQQTGKCQKSLSHIFFMSFSVYLMYHGCKVTKKRAQNHLSQKKVAKTFGGFKECPYLCNRKSEMTRTLLQ